MRALIFSLLLPLCLLTPACSPQAAENAPAPAASEAAVHPVSGLKVIPLTITTLSKTHAFRVELAVTPQEQAKGLMFRTEMAQDEGMLFPYDQPRVLSFWMRNTSNGFIAALIRAQALRSLRIAALSLSDATGLA